MSSKQAAQQAAARAGVQCPDLCVRALSGYIHGRTYSIEWTPEDLMFTLEEVPYFVAKPYDLRCIIGALVANIKQFFFPNKIISARANVVLAQLYVH
jgi:hypothetical protein